MTTSVRVPEIDALRGLALLGILMVNVWFFTDPSGPRGGPAEGPVPVPDQAVRFLVATFVEGRFYLLFSPLLRLRLRGAPGLDSATHRPGGRPETRRPGRPRVPARSDPVLRGHPGDLRACGDAPARHPHHDDESEVGNCRRHHRGGLGAHHRIGTPRPGRRTCGKRGGRHRTGDRVGHARRGLHRQRRHVRCTPAVRRPVPGAPRPRRLPCGCRPRGAGVLRPHPPSRRVLVRVAVVALPPGLAVSALQAHLGRQGGEGLSPPPPACRSRPRRW